MTIDLVVSLYKENTEWVRNLRDDCKLVIYNKGDGPLRRLPNVGREAHTYLHHMARNYGHFKDWNFFTQGDPLAHCPNFVAIVNTWTDSFRKAALIAHPSHQFFVNQPVRYIETGATGDDASNDVRGLWRELFTNEPPEDILFAPASIFVISDERLMCRSLPFYQKALELSHTRPRGPWEFERLWAYLWRVKDKPRL